ncbi:MAG: polyamine ABC transporter substrate-binding protein [Chloroflexia bacterium]|nr:polyamine ABC transporter substrate-binding protein [Chloroflexia bacterium]MDQ3613999.1 ABC transporter substrate-binding protein [Chloroflexota bacterium]
MTKRKRSVALLMSFILVATSFGGFLGASGAGAQDRETLVFGINAADIGNLDPHYASATQDRAIVDMVFNGLVRFVPGTVSELEPDIAAEMPTATENEDGTQTWTVALRDDVMCQPSSETEAYQLTSADVVFSLQKAASDDTSNYASAYAGWTVEAVDDQTIEITVETPVSDALFLPTIANYSGGFIICQQPFEALGADGFITNPVGTGPFMFQEYTPQNSVVLAANDDYFRGAPALSGVEVRFIADGTTRELALQSGELHVAAGLPEAQWADRVSEQEGVVVDVFGVGEVLFLNINTTIEPFDDPLVREAIMLAISREGHIALSGAPVGEAVYSPVPAQLMEGGLTEEEATEADVNYEQDTARAMELLAEAGYEDGFEIDLVTSEMDSYRLNYEVLADELRQIGVTVNLEVVQHAAMHELIRQDENALTFYVAYRPNADVYLSQFFTEEGGVTNFSKYDVSDLVEEARATTDSAEQAELWKQANINLQQDFAGYGILLVNQVYARQDTVDYGHELNAVINLYPGIDETTSISGD